MAIGSMPSSARIWADAIGWVTYGSPVARRWPSWASDREVEGIPDRFEVGAGMLLQDRREEVRAQGLEIGGGRRLGDGLAGSACEARGWCRWWSRPERQPWRWRPWRSLGPSSPWSPCRAGRPARPAPEPVRPPWDAAWQAMSCGKRCWPCADRIAAASQPNPARRRAASASARSFHGSGPAGPMIERSWPLPARSTMSPGRARSKAASMAARRSAMTRRSWPRRRPAASAPARDRLVDGVPVLAPRILVGDDHQPAALAGDPAHLGPLGRVALAGRAEDRDQAAAPRGRTAARDVEHGLRARRGCGRSRRSRRTAGRARRAPSARARRARRRGPRRTAAGSRPSGLAEGDDGQRVVDVEAPDELEVDRGRPRRRRDGDPEAARRPPRPGSARTSAARVRAVGQHPRAGLLGRPPMKAPGRRVVEVDDPGARPGLRPGARRRRGGSDARRGARTARAWRPGTPPRSRGARGARGSGWSRSRRRRRSRRPARAPARARSSRRRRRRPRPRPSPGARPGAPAPRASWRAPRWAPGARRPGSRPCRACPVRMPAASSAATARNAVVVLPSVPVIPTTAELVARIAVPPGRRGRERGWLSVHDELRRIATSGSARSTRAAAAPRAPRLAHEVVAVDVQPGDGHEERAGANRPRVVGDAGDGDPGQGAGTDGPAVAPGTAQARLRPQALDELAERSRLGRLGRREERRRQRRVSVIGGPARGQPGGQPSQPRSRAGVEDPLVGAGQLQPLAAERALVLVEPVHRRRRRGARGGRR